MEKEHRDDMQEGGESKGNAAVDNSMSPFFKGGEASNRDGEMTRHGLNASAKPPAESPVLLPIMRNAVSDFSPTGTSLISKRSGGDAQSYFTEAQAIIAAQIAARAAADVGLCYPWNFTQGQVMPPHTSGMMQELDRRRSSSVAETDTMDVSGQADGVQQVSMAANDDGYNWRKYGEKNVKGSKYPRSYYKCSTPGCTMKKVVERDPVSGIISNTLLKGGEHNHARPNAARVDVSAFVQSATQAAHYVQEDTSTRATPKRKRTSIQSSNGDGSERYDGTRVIDPEDVKKQESEDQTEETAPIAEKDNSKEDMKESAVMALQLLGTGFSPDIPSLGPGMSGTPANLLPLPATLRSSPLISKAKNGPKKHTLYTVYSSPHHQAPGDMLDHGEVKSEDEWEMAEEDFGTEDDETVNAAIAAAAAYICRELKDPSMDNNTAMKPDDAMIFGGDFDTKKAIQKRAVPKGPREKKSDRKKEQSSKTVIRTETDSDQIEDGYKWRKYGQKVVKGNPHPRSYYKCTSTGCRVRKQVERCSDNVGVLITTYEGKHTHDPPLMRNNPRPRVKMPGDQGYMADHSNNQVLSPAVAPACFPMLSPASLMASESPNTFGHHFLSGSPSIHQETPDHFPNSLGISSPAEQLQLYSIQQAATQQRINAHLVQQAKAWQEALARSPAALQTFHMLAQQQRQSPHGGSLDAAGSQGDANKQK